MFLKKTKEKNGGQSRWECFDEFWRDVSTFVSLMEGFLFILIYIWMFVFYLYWFVLLYVYYLDLCQIV
jgi:hypothetical protein